jgi:hypothetical protein
MDILADDEIYTRQFGDAYHFQRGVWIRSRLAWFKFIIIP